MEEFLAIVGVVLLVIGCALLGLACAFIGFFTGIWFSSMGAKESLQSREPKSDTPAKLLYLHRRGWRDWNQIMALGWGRMVVVTNEWFKWELLPAGIGMGVGAYLGTGTFLAILALVHGMVLALWSMVSYTVQAILKVVEWVRFSVLGISPPCHNCNRPFATPIFLCTVCSAEHAALIPGRFGYFHHTCQCGKSLPALSWKQKAPMIALCPKDRCRQSVDPSRKMPICIALAGGTSQGKTHVLIRVVRDLLSGKVEPGWNVTPKIKADSQIIEELFRQHAAGDVDKTPADVPRALNLRLCFRDGKPERLLYLYDPGGEAFQHGGSLSQHPYYGYANAVVFIIDPFALSGFVETQTLLSNQQCRTVCPGEFNPAEAFTNFKNQLWAAQRLSLKSACRLPLSVVLTKMDAPGMLELLASMPGEDTSDRCKALLCRAGLGTLTNNIERSFKTRRYFALGEFDPSVNNLDAERSGDAFGWAIRHQHISVWTHLFGWGRLDKSP